MRRVLASLRRLKRIIVMTWLQLRATIRTRKRELYNWSIRAYYAMGNKVQCNVCGWQGRSLKSDVWHPHTICPNCASQVRHRLLVAALDELDSVGWQRVIDGKRVLHFAPERALQPIIRSRTSRYVRADLLADGYNYSIDIELDIANMAALTDGELDCLIACDVLEHVPEHRSALAEISRVLCSGGCAILTVPQKDGLLVTLEDQSVRTPEARQSVYGQWNHLRIYGDDFPHLLEEYGFSVVTVDEHCFLTEDASRHVLCPPVRSTNPLATNYRKVFFAFK